MEEPGYIYCEIPSPEGSEGREASEEAALGNPGEGESGVGLQEREMLLFSCSVVSDSLQPHGLQHARLPCPLPTPGALLKLLSIELVMPSFLCHPLLLLLQSFAAAGSFLRSQFFTSGGQSIGVSASASVLPMNIQD